MEDNKMRREVLNIPGIDFVERLRGVEDRWIYNYKHSLTDKATQKRYMHVGAIGGMNIAAFMLAHDLSFEEAIMRSILDDIERYNAM